MQEKFYQYNLMTELAKKYSHSTYLACPTSEPDHQVVLTVFSSSLFHLPHERESLLQKAQRIKELQHPHLAPTLAVGIEKEQVFITREYLLNESLRDHLKKISPGRLPLREALTIVSQAGQALAYVHKQNIFHGNIKPENIFFGADGQILLTDFHLVARNDAIIRDQATENYAFCYLAPERFAGIYDARGDQYALGCLAYELITGRVPFVAQSLASIMGEHNTTLPPPLSESVPNLPPTLEAAIFKALAKDPRERFFDFALFLEVIQSVLSPPPVFPLIRSTHSRKRSSAIIFGEMPQLEDRSPKLGTATQLMEKEVDAVLFTDIFEDAIEPLMKEETPSLLVIDPFETEEESEQFEEDAFGSSDAYEQSGYRSDKTTSSLIISKTDMPGRQVVPRMRGRRRHLARVLLLSLLLALLMYAFWSVRLLTPDTSSQPTGFTNSYPKIHSTASPVFLQIPFQKTVNPTPIPVGIPPQPALRPPVAAVVGPAANPTPTPTPVPASSIVQSTAANTQVLPIDDSMLGTGINQFNYVGPGWYDCTNCGSDLYNETNTWSNTAGDYVTLAFTGVQICFYGVRDPKHGEGMASIDGGSETPVYFYASVRAGNQLLWTSPILPAGSHTFNLSVTGQPDPNNPDPSSSNTYVAVDGVAILSTPGQRCDPSLP